MECCGADLDIFKVVMPLIFFYFPEKKSQKIAKNR
jgi:hypothetical protein